MRVLRRLGFLILLLAAAGSFAAWRLAQPYRGFTGETFVELPHGMGTRAMGEELARAGEYKFDRAASPLEVVWRIAHGDIFYYELVVPEGRNLFDIGAEVERLGV